MRHRMSHRGFSRTSAHRKAMFENLAASLIKHEQIRTTLPKAKDLRPIAERLITLGKRGGLHARRQAIAKLGDAKLADKLLTTLAERYADRPAAIPASSRPGSATATTRRWRSSNWSTATSPPKARIPDRGRTKTRKPKQRHRTPDRGRLARTHRVCGRDARGPDATARLPSSARRGGSGRARSIRTARGNCLRRTPRCPCAR